MKPALTLSLICLLALPAYPQKASMDFARIDRNVVNISPASPKELAEKLTSSYNGELEKTRAIFRWITENIGYRMREPVSRRSMTRAAYDPKSDTAELKSLDERVAESVLEKGTAVCDGYARLFKTLCRYAGVEAELITGYARTGSYKASQSFHSNHTWNAVRIEGSWQLLDVTWACGYASWSTNTFTREFDENYFLIPPEEFIRDHYPDELSWSLLANTPVIPEFRNSPFRQRSFRKYRIRNFQPSRGIIETAIGDTLRIQLEVNDLIRDKQIGADPFLNASLYNSAESVVLTPSATSGNKISFNYRIVSADVKWIYILYNGDLILRYTLSVKHR
jgi:hypothetical protein